MSAEKLSLYYGAFISLMILTALTVLASFIDFGRWGLTVALLIATSKALVVIIIFMHVRHASHLLKLFVILGFLWLIHLLGGTFGDYLTRGLPEETTKTTWVPDINPQYYPSATEPHAKPEVKSGH